MTVTNTSLLGLALPYTGTESGVWGDDVNNGFTILVDISVAGTNNITQDSDITLAVSNGSNSSSFTSTATNSTVAQYYVLNCTGARTANRNIIAPASSKTYYVINSTTTATTPFTITIKKSGGTGVTIPPGAAALVAYNGTDFQAINAITGVLGFSDTNIVMSAQASANTYVQGIIQNSSSGTSASADFIVANNLSTATTYYGDFGINSSTFSGTGSLSAANATYVTATSGDLALGTTTSNAIHFVINSGTTDAMTINTSGALALNGSYGTSGQVLTSGGSSAVPTWTTVTGTVPSPFTANGVVYASSTSALATGSALTFDGTNLGVGVTPSAWAASQRALDIGTTGALIADTSANSGLAHNAYYGSSAWTYKTTNFASLYSQTANGQHNWYNAPSGTAGTAVSFTQAMTLTNASYLGIGNTSPQTNLSIGSSAGSGSNGLGIYLARGATTNFLEAYDGTKTFIAGTDSSNSYVKVGSLSNHNLNIVSNNGAGGTLTLDTSGNLGLGVTPSAWTGAFKVLEVKYAGNAFASASNEVDIFNNAINNGSSTVYGSNGYATLFQMNNLGQFRWYLSPSGSAGASINGGSGSFNLGMTLDNSGNLLVGTTSGPSTVRLNVLSSSSDSTAYIRNSNATPYGLDLKYTTATPNNTGSEFIYCEDNTALRMSVRSNGGIANYQANDVNLSDRREKTNFSPAKSYLDVICAIPVQTFNYIDQNLEQDGGLTLGVVAQDVQAVAPELVMESNWAKEGDEPKMRLSIYQTDLQYALMKCIQELSAKVTALEAKLGV